MLDASQVPNLTPAFSVLSGGPPANPLNAPAPSVPAASVEPDNSALSGNLPIPTGKPLASVTVAPVPMSFSQKMAQAADNLGIPANTPGGWARSLVGAAQSALAGGDVGQVPTGAGFFHGAGVEAQNIQQQKAAQQARQDKLNQQAIENTREDKRNDILNAYTQAMTVASQRTAAKLDEESMIQHVEAGKTAAAALRKNHPVVAEGITEDQLLPEFKPGGKYDPSTNIGYQTSTTEVEKGGKLVEEPTYTIFKREGGTVKVDADSAKLLAKYGSTPVPEGTELEADRFDHQMTGALAAQSSANLLKSQQRKEEISELTDNQTIQKAADLKTVNPYLGAHRDDPISALNSLAQQKDKTGKLTDQAVAAGRILSTMDEKDLETHRKNKAEEQEKINKDNLGRQQDQRDTWGALPQDIKVKMSTLPQPLQDHLSTYDPAIVSEIFAIADGTDDPSKIVAIRTTKGGKPNITTAEASGLAHMINPKYDPTKATTYAATRKDFATGKAATSINSLNTAIGHLADLYDHTSFATTVPGVSGFDRTFGIGDAKAAQNDLELAAPEIQKVYKGAAPTKEETAGQKEALGGSTPAAQRKAIVETAHLIKSKIDSLRHQWDTGTPGSPFAFDLLSQESIDALNKIDPTILNPQSPQAHQEAAVAALPQTVISRLKEGTKTTLGNGQIWTLQNGKPTMLQGQP